MKRQVIGMKERINRLAKGIIDSEQPKMTWSPEKIDETLREEYPDAEKFMDRERKWIKCEGICVFLEPAGADSGG